MPFLLKYIKGMKENKEACCWVGGDNLRDRFQSVEETKSLLFASLLLSFVLPKALLLTWFSFSLIHFSHLLSLHLFTLSSISRHSPCSSYLPPPPFVFVKSQCFISSYLRPLQSHDPGFYLQTRCPNPSTLHFLTH